MRRPWPRRVTLDSVDISQILSGHRQQGLENLKELGQSRRGSHDKHWLVLRHRGQAEASGVSWP